MIFIAILCNTVGQIQNMFCDLYNCVGAYALLEKLKPYQHNNS